MLKQFDEEFATQYDQYLSFHDLEKLDDWRDVLVNEDVDRLEEILYTHGCDMVFGYSLVSDLHQPRTENRKVEYFGPRFLFRERRDKEFEPYRHVTDIARTDPSSTVRSGMKESLNAGVSLNDVIEEALSTNVRLLEMKHEKKKGKK